MSKVYKIEVYCPNCTNRLEAEIKYRGHQITCQGCGTLMVVPANAKVVSKKLSFTQLMGAIVIWVSVVLVALNFIPTSSNKGEKRDGEKEAFNYPKASPEQRDHIKSALGEKYTVHECRVIEAGGEYRGYFIGARFSYEGIEKLETVVGVWWIGGAKNDPALLLSVNGIAYTHSRMGWASKSKIGYSMADWEAQVLQEALRN